MPVLSFEDGTMAPWQPYTEDRTMPTVTYDRLLSRKEIAEALTKEGFTIAESTLATKATIGGGPPYRKFGRYVKYDWNDALNWANGRLSDIFHNSSEARSKTEINDKTGEAEDEMQS
jgi:hypothetical protein